MPSGAAFRFLRMGDDGQFSVGVEIEVLLRGPKWQVRSQNAESQEEGFVSFILSQGVELL